MALAEPHCDELCSNPEENGELLEGLSPTSRSCGGLPASPPACPSPTRRPRFRQLLERSPGWPLAASPFLTARGAAPPTPVPFLAAPGGPRPSGQQLPVQTAEEPFLKAAVRPPLPAGVLRAHRPSPVSPAPGEQAPLRCVGSAVQPSPGDGGGSPDPGAPPMPGRRPKRPATAPIVPTAQPRPAGRRLKRGLRGLGPPAGPPDP
eukprot:EG_transcript_27170